MTLRGGHDCATWSIVIVELKGLTGVVRTRTTIVLSTVKETGVAAAGSEQGGSGGA